MQTKEVSAGDLKPGDRVVVYTTMFGFADGQPPATVTVTAVHLDEWGDGTVELADGRDVEVEGGEPVIIVTNKED